MSNKKWLNKVPLKIGYYLAGFVDGEGSFNVSLRKKSDYKTGWQVVLSFNVSQKDKVILTLLKRYLGCGIIKQRSSDGLYSYDVTNSTAIVERVIPFFKKFGFLSPRKKKNFAIFKKIAYLVENKQHLNEAGLRQILELREKLNEGKGRSRKYSIYGVFPKESPETIRQTPAKR